MPKTMQPATKTVTLEQLLSHTSGMPEDNAAFIEILARSFAQDALNLDELRHWFVREWTALPLDAAPGSRFAYSNAGYTVAGAMLERAQALGVACHSYTAITRAERDKCRQPYATNLCL